MKNNIAFQLAKASVMKEKKNYMISFCMMLIAFVFTFIFSGYLVLSQRSVEIDKMKTYGGWNICYENQNQEILNLFESSSSVDEVCQIEVSDVLPNGNYIANYIPDYFTMNSVTLIDGQYPQNEDEVLVLRSRKAKIGEIIQVHVSYPDETIKEFKVVGIVNDYNTQWTNPSVEYFGYHLDLYKTYTYVFSSLPVSTLIDVDDCIFNFSLLLQDAILKVDKRDGVDNPYSISLEKTTTNSLMNSFVLVVSAGLFISVFYNINQREKNVFLLRCIGMSKKNMRKYIFYEVIIIAMIALGLSFVVGSVVLLGFSLFYYAKIHAFLFVDGLMQSLSYIGLLLVFIVCFVYLSILPISIHSMDGLIHKKERKVMKKYHKAQRMNVFRLTNRIQRRYRHYAFSLSMLIIVQAVCLNSLLSFKSVDASVSYNSSSQYEYIVQFYDERFIRSIEELIDELVVLKYQTVETPLGTNEIVYSFDSHFSYGYSDNTKFPENVNECMIFDYFDYNRYNAGDKISFGNGYYNDSSIFVMDEIKRNATIVGEIDLSNLYHLAQENYYTMYMPVRGTAFVVLDDAFDQDDWEYCTYIKTHKNIFFQLNELANEHYPYKNEGIYGVHRVDMNKLFSKAVVTNVENRIYNGDLIYVPVFFISILFVIFIVRLLVDRLNKDFKLTRCLGMTFKQTMLSYLRIAWEIISFPLIYYTILFLGTYNLFEGLGMFTNQDVYMLVRPLIIIYSLCLMNITGFMLYAYHKTNTTVTFYPTDVERYY